MFIDKGISCCNNNTDIFSIGEVGDLTYPYVALENSTKVINEIVNNKHKLSDLIKNIKNQ